LTATAGTAAAGATLLARDRVHDAAGRPAVLACITAGALLSAVLAEPRLAPASATAFAVSELADLAVHQPLRRRGLLRAVLASNAVGAPLDSIVFLTLTGPPVRAALARPAVGQDAGHRHPRRRRRRRPRGTTPPPPARRFVTRCVPAVSRPPESCGIRTYLADDLTESGCMLRDSPVRAGSVAQPHEQTAACSSGRCWRSPGLFAVALRG
jgi:hypothetical protein